MIDVQRIEKSKLYSEFIEEDRSFWFDMKAKKFLHNIDTFYYSVKLQEDFTADSQDKKVLAFRREVQKIQSRVTVKAYTGDIQQFFIPAKNDFLNVIPVTFARLYSFCLEAPEQFDIFIAPVVPGNQDGLSVTSEIVVQIRASMLWNMGVNAAFEESYKWVQAICSQFDFSIDEVKENRTDFCWHTNYLEHPEKFFSLDNFFKMKVTTLDRKGVNYHIANAGSEGYEVDYVALGSRGDKCFLRMYLKSKEVIEEGYKAFFLKTWLFHGLINRYDFDVYEQAYLAKSWSYCTIARLNFYAQHGSNPAYIAECKRMVAIYDMCRKVTDGMIELADQLTPPVNLVMNIEFQLMRKASKTYDILPIKDNTDKGATKRIYDFLDNRRLITDYLTTKTFRLVEKTGDSNKGRRPDCGFWAALRRSKMVDVAPVPESLKIHRIYNRKMNAESLRQTIIHKAVTYGMYMKGINDDNPVSDAMLALLRLNDNDIQNAKRYKLRKAKQLNKDELAEVMPEQPFDFDFMMVDKQTGLLLNPEDIGGYNDAGGAVESIPFGQDDLLCPEDDSEL